MYRNGWGKNFTSKGFRIELNLIACLKCLVERNLEKLKQLKDLIKVSVCILVTLALY